jgi:hypothetical protein
MKIDASCNWEAEVDGEQKDPAKVDIKEVESLISECKEQPVDY